MSEDVSVESDDTGMRQPVFPDAATFFDIALGREVERRLGRGLRWCPQWQRHPEAVARVTALWLAWEEMGVSGDSGLSSWWLDHADRHLARLMDGEHGPFGNCSPEHGHASDGPPWPLLADYSQPAIADEASNSR